MSAILLAELLDELSGHDAFVRESENDVFASSLTVDESNRIIALCNELDWDFDIFDRVGTEWEKDCDLLQDFSPYRLQLRKPPNSGDELVLLTNAGFAEWLRVGHAAVNWKVARLQCCILTRARVLQPWGETEIFQPSASTKSPRFLVREFGPERFAPEDVRPWLLRDEASALIDDDATKVWMNASVFSLLNSLADEIDAIDYKLKFTGPPKLLISIPVERDTLADGLDLNQFYDLQRAANWVFENEREAELRHGLLAGDIARTSGDNSDGLQCFFRNISASLDGAKVAYQVSLSDLGRDTLKILTDLRKAVTEETAKVTDATRQLVTSVSGALAISVGLIAARVSSAASSELIVAVMLIVDVYLGVVIYSGYGFIQLQRQLRSDWQSRLYRFLPPNEYESMVISPSMQVERTFVRVAWGGSIGIVLLTVIVIFGWWGNTVRNNVVSESLVGQLATNLKATISDSQSVGATNKVECNAELKALFDEPAGSEGIQISKQGEQLKDITAP